MSKVQLPMMLEVLSETHPGSEFSLVSFKDKPILPFGIPPTTENGYYSDYCAHIESHLTANLSAVIERYESSHPMGGGDPSENQFHALLGATQAEGIKWPNNPDRAQLLVLVTDAPPHFEDDGSDPQGMRPSTGTFDEANVDTQCVTEFYPNPEQVKASIMQRNAYTAFLIYDPEYMEGLVGRSWLWFNRFINQTDEFITLQAENSSDFWTKLAGIIGIIEDIECLPQSSTVVPTQPQTSAEVTPSQTPPASGVVTAIGTPEVTGTPCPPCPPCPACPVPPCVPCPPCECAPPCPPKDCPEFTKLCEDGVMIKLGQPVDELRVVVNGREW
eukprot:Gregarina_sp_Poly_1__3892@NODE_2165_length_2573_cov_3193_364725_g1396_i0_p1_GENE_NODE_2165_length_2573_cov_3193_364725_g1396_i0NODE_2165_length_2573_cov_3193_364725_g1396_i0_p1_ORF_typecomplete_len339_score44_64Integrin_beta/PF00362_18/4_8e20VWA/PF00092_28/0_1VWA_2/PF13519_6/0_22VWA_3/PF13768_6/0_38_NODE_2165_length_2573_cov_3193_364725_g1396_i0281017